MKQLFKRLKKWFKSLSVEAIPNRTTRPENMPALVDYDFIPALFVTVGHNIKAQGASCEFGEKESEWVFNNPVADNVLNILDSICPLVPVFKLLRPVGSYRHQVRSIKKAIKKITNGLKSYGVNLHFNSGGGIGSENLIAKGTKENFDNFFADKFSDALEVVLGIPQRRDGGVFEVDENHDGAGMINGQREVGCTTIILEPVFSHNHVHAHAIFNHPKRYARIISETIVMAYLWRGFIQKSDIKEKLLYWDTETLKPINPAIN